MGIRGGRNPVRVGTLLTAAVPALAERMLEDAVRREWAQTAGPETARRSRPGALRQGTLDVSVDNSPWLQELTLRSAAILAALRKRHGPAVTGIRFALGRRQGDGPGAEGPARAGTEAPERRLNAEEARIVDAAAETGTGLVEADSEAVAGNAAPDEDHVTVSPPDAFTPEREVVDVDGHALTALGSGHGSAMIRAAPGGVNLAPSRLTPLDAAASVPRPYPCGSRGAGQV